MDAKLTVFVRACSYVKVVQGKVEENARLEWKAITAEVERTGASRADLSNKLSEKINEMAYQVGGGAGVLLLCSYLYAAFSFLSSPFLAHR